MLLTVAAFVLASPLLIKTATVDISPPEPLPLGGYTERHDKVMEEGGDPLHARCILLEQGPTHIAIVSVETLTIPESLYREVKARIPKGVELFMQATHTHSAPDSQMLNDRMTFKIPGIATYKRRMLEWYAAKIAPLVSEAESNASTRAKDVSIQVSIVNANRARREGGKPDPTFAAVDTGRVRLFDYFTAHPIIYGPENLKTRGDWPGILAERDHCLVLNGAIGDVSPKADGPSVDDKFKDFWRNLETVDKSYPVTAWTPHDHALSWSEESIELDAKKPHPTFAKKNGIPEALAQSLTDQFAPPEARIVAVRLGSLAIVGVPGEPTSILGNEIKAAGMKMGFRVVLVCSHVNGWMGYILDPADYDRGGYEAELSFYGREEGRKVVDAAVATLKKL